MSEKRARPDRTGETLAFDFDAKPPPPPSAPPPPPQAKEEIVVFTVGQLGRIVIRALERNFSDPVWVEGEISGTRAAPSGHLYFCLKDEEEEAVIDVVMYRASLTPRGRTLVRDGARIRLRGRPTFWAPRGRLQFIGDRIEPTGKGALLEALEQLKAKLVAEGLFRPERKRPLPAEPRIVGVVTSKAGAVIHDIVKVAFRRGGARILLAPAQVQGFGSAEAVRRALAALQRIPEVDVIIVARGGGSQDDLLAFHDEQLVRDVVACRVPVVSAVGHETDFTLVDFAADKRAATPSQAAEMVVPDAVSARHLLAERQMRLRRAMTARIADERARTARLAAAFRDPRLLIASAQQHVDDQVSRLSRAASRRIAKERDVAARLSTRLSAAHPRERIARDAGKVHALQVRLAELARARLIAVRKTVTDANVRLEGATRADLVHRTKDLGSLAGRLDAMSPLKVLGRGYAIATRADGHAVRDANEVQPGDRVHVRVARGAFDAEVKEIGIDDAPPSKPKSKKGKP